MERPEADLVEALDHAVGRLLDRMDGLTDDEWSWCPVPTDERISIRWRLDHVATTLAEPRCRTWLGLAEESAIALAPAVAADDALARVRRSAEDLGRSVRRSDLTRAIGPAAGPWAAATRRSFVLHLLDESVHHGAEAALLRDLWAGRPLS